MTSRSQRTKIYLIRHGQTDWNVEHRLTSRTDRPLTALGERQARAAGAFFAARGIALDAAFASPLSRAYRTAELALASAGSSLVPVADPRLVEVDCGPFEGWTEAEVAVSAEAQAWRAGARIEGAEHDSDAVVRARSVLRDLSAMSGNILLASHGHFLRMLIAHGVLEIPQGEGFRVKIHNGSPSVIDLTPGRRPSLIGLNLL